MLVFIFLKFQKKPFSNIFKLCIKCFYYLKHWLQLLKKCFWVFLFIKLIPFFWNMYTNILKILYCIKNIPFVVLFFKMLY